MTQIQWQQLEATVAQMTDAEKQRLTSLLEKSVISLKSEKEKPDPVIGLFADEPELMEKVIELVYRDRETAPFRTGQ
jgi:hypothetical protein